MKPCIGCNKRTPLKSRAYCRNCLMRLRAGMPLDEGEHLTQRLTRSLRKKMPSAPLS